MGRPAWFSISVQLCGVIDHTLFMISTVSGPSASEKNWAMLCHLAALAPLVGVPFGQLLGPLVVWMVGRGESPFVDRHGRESLNFHLSWTLYTLLATLLFVVPFALGAVGFAGSASPQGLALPLVGSLFFALAVYGVIAVTGLICTLVAAIKAANGETYVYPLAFPFLQ